MMLSKLKPDIPDKWRLLSISSLSFAISFMVFIYSPVDIYLHNPTAFVVSWRFFMPPLVIITFAAFLILAVTLILITQKNAMFGFVLFLIGGAAVLTARYVFDMFSAVSVYILIALVSAAVLWLLAARLIKDKLPDLVLLIIWGVFLSSYVQALLLNSEMTTISDAQGGYSLFSFTQIMYLLIWIVITLLPVSIWFLFKVKKKTFNYDKALLFSALIIVGMQTTGLVSTAAATNLPKGYDEDYQGYFSYEAALSFNPEENILVFIIDRLDVLMMREVLEANPHVRGYLDGFTHYENSMAEYHDTLPSTTSMLTQVHYKQGQTISEYWAAAWSQPNALDLLKENDFTVNLYIDYMSTYGTIDDIRDRTDNIRGAEGLRVDAKGFFGPITRISLGRLSPYPLKSTLLSPVTHAFGNSFFKADAPTALAVQPPVIGEPADLRFFEFIKESELSADNEKRVFMFMHMNGAHAGGGRGGIPGIESNLEILNVYFGKMRDIGVYDNSTIIIMGDHGWGSDIPVSTSVLIKPAGSFGNMTVDSTSELSHKYFPATILELAGIPYDRFNLSYFDIIAGAPPPVRVLYDLSSWWSTWEQSGTSGTMTLRGIYEVIGDSLDAANWSCVENIR